MFSIAIFATEILPQKRSTWHTGGGGGESSAPYMNGNGCTCQGASLGWEEKIVNSKIMTTENKIQLFKSDMFGNIRVMTDENDEPWFVGKDMASALRHNKIINLFLDAFCVAPETQNDSKK